MGVNAVELVGGCKRSGTGGWVSTQWNRWVGVNRVELVWVGVNTVELVGGCKHGGTGGWV